MIRRSLGIEMALYARNGGGTVAKSLKFVKASSSACALGDCAVRGPNDSWNSEARCNMPTREASPLFLAMIGQVVVVDLQSTYVCLGTLVGGDDSFLEMIDADFHDFRDSTATREIYVYDSARYGIRRNRARILLRLDDVVAITRFADIAAS